MFLMPIGKNAIGRIRQFGIAVGRECDVAQVRVFRFDPAQSGGKPERAANAGRPLIIGLLTGVMPCGALSAMWLCAMSSGSAARGALVMLVFSLGTVPLLFLFGALQSFLPRGWMKYIVKGSAVLVVTLGLSMLVKGIRLFGM